MARRACQHATPCKPGRRGDDWRQDEVDIAAFELGVRAENGTVKVSSASALALCKLYIGRFPRERQSITPKNSQGNSIPCSLSDDMCSRESYQGTADPSDEPRLHDTGKRHAGKDLPTCRVRGRLRAYGKLGGFSSRGRRSPRCTAAPRRRKRSGTVSEKNGSRHVRSRPVARRVERPTTW